MKEVNSKQNIFGQKASLLCLQKKECMNINKQFSKKYDSKSSLYSFAFFPQQKINIISVMGCENSNLIEVVPQTGIQNIQPYVHNENELNTPGGQNLHQENKQSKELSIKQNPSVLIGGNKQNKSKEENGEETKRKTKSEFKITENIMNDKTNIQQTTEKKKSWVVGEKGKILSARDNDKNQNKVQGSNSEIPCGPSSRSIENEPKIQLNQPQNDKQLLGAFQKLEVPSVQFITESLQGNHKDQIRSTNSNCFKFEVFAQSSGEILSKTQRLNQKMEEYLQKQEVSRFLSMIQYGQKQQIIGKVYQQLQKRERWEAPSENGDKLIVVESAPQESK